MSKKLLSAVARQMRVFALLAVLLLNGQLVCGQQPAEQQPAEQQPAEQQPAEQQPAEQQPAEQQPAEQQPAEQQPAEQEAVEQEAVDDSSDAEAPEVDSDGDAIPDAIDPLPFSANAPIYWSVQKFSLSRPSAGEPADTAWASAPSLDIATVLHAPRVESSLTVLPLPSRKPVIELKGHPFAPLAVFGTDAIRLGDLQRARAAAFLRGWRADGANQPIQMTFSVRFLNLGLETLKTGHLEVPVMLGGKKWSTAKVVSKKLGDYGILLPGDKQVRENDFVAEVDASAAKSFLEHLVSSDFTPSFDFAHAAGLDPEVSQDNLPPFGQRTLSAALLSIFLKTRQIRIEGPDGLVWTWRVAPVDLRSGVPVTFGQWAEGVNALSQGFYGAPLFAFDGNYPISIAGWDNGCWDLYWSVSRKGREISPSDLAASRLKADMVLSLSATPPAELPPEGATPILSHLRGVWQHHHGLEEEAVASFSAAGHNGAPQGHSWCGHCKSLMQNEVPNGPSGDGRTQFGQNQAEAVRLYKLAADADYAPGLAWYGRALVHGDGIGANKVAGVAELKKAADQGFAEGRFLYALFLRKGVGVKADPNEALKLLTQAAWQGSNPAMAALGEFLLDSGSLEGRDWIELAANNGDDKAAARLARFLRDGEFGTTPNPKAAAEWLQRAADAGDAQSLLSLGEALRAGVGVRRNPKMAVEYFRRAAEAGNSDGMTWYALCLLEGKGVRRDVPKAIDLLGRAADTGNANAKFFHGVCLFGGYGGTEPDKPAAMLRFRNAASEQPAASVFLGVGYLNGLGLAKNEKKAVECFKSAAERDFPAGILWLAHCYANGIGVKKDLEEARKWARKAADLGVPAGRQMLLSIQE